VLPRLTSSEAASHNYDRLRGAALARERRSIDGR